MSVVLAFEPGHEKETYVFGKFQEFLKKHNKKYTTIEEYLARFNAFKNNYNRMEAFSMTESSHSVGITKFFDMTPQEFRRTYRNLKMTALNQIKSQATLLTLTEDANLPESHDWREHGAVGPVKDQGQCGSCWAFSAVGNLEGAYFLKHKKLEQFAEQQLVDCDHNGDEGCNGGLMEQAFEYLKQAGGIELAKDYKYTARGGTCKFDKNKVVAKVVSWQMVNENEETIKQFLYEHGPLAVALNAEPLQFYDGGIIDLSKEECDPEALDHGVTLVGYGVENNQAYWIVRNSWGAGWGEKGYFRMARGKGTCGINTHVVAAELE